MKYPAPLHVLRVFTDEAGENGNPLGVFVDGTAIAQETRQAIATELGFSETVFVVNPGSGRIHIHTPVAEIPFAGHPTVGTAWLLRKLGQPVGFLRPPPGALRVRYSGELTSVSARADWCPSYFYLEHPDPDAVDALSPNEFTRDTYNWAWVDQRGGRIRSRGFYPEHNIIEDQATGSAALALAVRLDRRLEVSQGAGCRISATPVGDGWGEISGRVALVETR